MIIPIRCFTCGKVIGNKWETYLGFLQAEYTEGYVFTAPWLLNCVVALFPCFELGGKGYSEGNGVVNVVVWRTSKLHPLPTLLVWTTLRKASGMGRSFKCYWAQNWRPNLTTPVLSSIWLQEKKPHHSRSKAMWVSFYDVGLLEHLPFYTLLQSIIFNCTCFWSHWPYVNIAVPIIPPSLNILSLEFWKCPTP